jgi:uncharacterized membrane-anchored protein
VSRLTHSRSARKPLAAKVPEIIGLFWVIKILTTFMGEAVSDYLLTDIGIAVGATIEVALVVVALLIQFRTRRYVAAAYWFLAAAIAVFGTGIADGLHVLLHIPYGGTVTLWAAVLALIFWRWYRREGTLSFHSITTRRRERYYWATVFATFALGTALGDFAATVLHLGFLASGLSFGVIILVPPVARWRFGLNGIAAFWMSYVVTRPLGASFADYFIKQLNVGAAITSLIPAIVVVILVSYLSITRKDIQSTSETAIGPAQHSTLAPDSQQQ